MCGVDDLIAFGETRDGLSKLLLLEGMQAEAGLVEEQDRVFEGSSQMTV